MKINGKRGQNEWKKEHKLNLMCHAHAIPNSIKWNMMIKPILFEYTRKVFFCQIDERKKENKSKWGRSNKLID